MFLLSQVVFPISKVKTWVFLPPVVTFFLAYFGVMAGVTGAFLLLPFQISILGYTAPGVSATNFVYNIFAIPSTVWRYAREGRLNWSLALIISAGSLPGILIGYLLRIRFLSDQERFKPFVALVLLYLAYRLSRDLLKRREKGSIPDRRASIKTCRISFNRISFEFDDSIYSYDPRHVFLVAFLVGMAGGAYGIGGGAVLAPYCITVLRLPVYSVAGASLFGTFVSSVAGVFVYSLGIAAKGLNTRPDIYLGSLFGLGGLLGGYLGAKTQKFIPERLIKGGLLIIILLIIIKYSMSLYDFFLYLAHSLTIV